MDVKEIGSVNPSTHWYFQHKLRAVIAALNMHTHNSRNLVDYGAGSGYFSQFIGEMYKFSDVYQVDTAYKPEEIGRFGRVQRLTQLQSCQGDVYLMLDVLEHLDDAELHLREQVNSAADNALFIITVPALNALWSGHDVFLEHRRRYRLESVQQLCEVAGLQVVEARYLYSLLLPLVWLRRKLFLRSKIESQLRPTNSIVNAILLTMLSPELRGIQPWKLGSSVLVVARKIL